MADEPTPTHGDIMRAVSELQKDVGIILMDVQGVKTTLAAVEKCLGKEDEDERGIRFGTGLVGRHMRLQSKVDQRFRTYDDWRHYALGAAAAAMVLIAVLWWLIENRLADILK